MKYFWLLLTLILFIGVFMANTFQKEKQPITVDNTAKVLGNIDVFLDKIIQSRGSQGIDGRLILVLNKIQSTDNIYIQEVENMTTMFDMVANRQRIKIFLFRDRDLFIIAEVVFINNNYSIKSAVLVLQ